MEQLALTDHLDRSLITKVLLCLSDKYPGGLDWLDRRLDDIAAGRALLFQGMSGDEIAGLAIETPKGHHLKKLSTFFISPPYRRLRIGNRLMTSIQSSWERRNIDQVHVRSIRTMR
jgi:hypothetical protein